MNRRVWRVLARHRPAVIGGILLIGIAVAAAGAPWLQPYPQYLQNYEALLEPPGASHLMGTDILGRDTLSRVLWGARTSLIVAVAGGGLAILIGILVGTVSALWGRWYDYGLMRATDVLMALPTVFLALLVVAIVGASVFTLVWVLALVFWPSTARIVRAQSLVVKEMEFVAAAESLGSSRWRILRKHVLPSVQSVIVVQATIFVAQAILIETSLSYLGVGAQPPTASWGNMLSEGQRYIRQAWWLVTFPGAAIFVTVFALNMLGDGLRDALDPRSQHRV